MEEENFDLQNPQGIIFLLLQNWQTWKSKF